MTSLYGQTKMTKMIQTVLQQIEAYCNPRKNEVLETHRFWCVKFDDFTSFEHFLTEVRRRAELCNFKEKDRMIRDKIVLSTSGKLQELLLRKKNLNLTSVFKFVKHMNSQIDTCKKLDKTKYQIP